MTETNATAPFELSTKGLLDHLKSCGAEEFQLEAAEMTHALLTIVVGDPKGSAELIPLMTAAIASMPKTATLVIQTLLGALARLELQRKKGYSMYATLDEEQQEKLREHVVASTK